MGSITITESEYVGEVSKTTSMTFECFDDFLAYKKVLDSSVKSPLTELKVGKEYRVIDEIQRHGFNIGDIIRVVNYDEDDTMLPYEAQLASGQGERYWVTVKEVEEV